VCDIHCVTCHDLEKASIYAELEKFDEHIELGVTVAINPAIDFFVWKKIGK
jgi:hypothetical protein